ncbi:hypothetical protein P3342_003212 [Pyrenophora teres f. teres]|nr:hypothetical protein P3342_003212 [Pyrenophora teres f. teres]
MFPLPGLPSELMLCPTYRTNYVRYCYSSIPLDSGDGPARASEPWLRLVRNAQTSQFMPLACSHSHTM